MAKKYKKYDGYTNKHPALTAFGVIFIVVVLAMCVCAITGYFLGWYGEFPSAGSVGDDSSLNDEDLFDVDSDFDFDGGSNVDNEQNGMLTSSDDNVFDLNWFVIEPEDYEEYGVDPLASEAYIVTANLSGTYYDARIDWYLEWDSSYTGSDSPYNYVSISYISNLDHQCTLSFINNFSTNIYLVAYRTAYPEQQARCKLDCLKSLESAVTIYSYSPAYSKVGVLTSGYLYDFSLSYTFGNGTISPDVTVDYSSVKCNINVSSSELDDWFKKYGLCFWWDGVNYYPSELGITDSINLSFSIPFTYSDFSLALAEALIDMTFTTFVSSGLFIEYIYYCVCFDVSDNIYHKTEYNYPDEFAAEIAEVAFDFTVSDFYAVPSYNGVEYTPVEIDGNEVSISDDVTVFQSSSASLL